jgi:hypothetical protein
VTEIARRAGDDRGARGEIEHLRTVV